MNFSIAYCITVALLSAFIVHASYLDYTIRSPQVTDYGEWGYFNRCDHGMVISGMKLKVEPHQGNGDDTALNAIRFLCDYIEDEQRKQDPEHRPVFITSKEGQFGEFGRTFKCRGGYVNGFQLRSEPPQGRFADDTAANNLRLYCSSGEMIEGDGLSYGDWTERQNCDAGFAACGFQTQVEDYQGDGDDTALNNLKVECCKLPDKKDDLEKPQEHHLNETNQPSSPRSSGKSSISSVQSTSSSSSSSQSSSSVQSSSSNSSTISTSSKTKIA